MKTKAELADELAEVENLMQLNTSNTPLFLRLANQRSNLLDQIQNHHMPGYWKRLNQHHMPTYSTHHQTPVTPRH